MSSPAQVELSSPRDFYTRRAEEVRADANQALALRGRYQMGFVALCVLAGVGFYLSLVAKSLPLRTLLLEVPVAAYFLAQSRRQQNKVLRLLRLTDYYDTAIARLTRNWEVLDEGSEFRDPDHFYASDLDLFGHGSLFQLLCSARTQAGRETLANWMKAPGSREEVLARRDAVIELRGRKDLHEALAMAGAIKVSDCRPGTFRAWVAGSSSPFPRWCRVIALALPCALLAVLFLYSFGRIDAAALSLNLAAVLLLEAIFASSFWSRVRSIAGDASPISVELPMVSEIFRIVEREHFSTGKLAAIAKRIEEGSGPMRRLRWLIQLQKLRDDPYFTALSYPLMWGTQFSMAIDGWRRRNGTAMLDWLTALGEFEALNSLAAYTFEHPLDVFPEIVEQGPLVDAEGLGHPLLDENTCVRNDARLGGDTLFLIVSGSNMSGKSTYLRAIGLNVVLAWMGAPVRCEKLQVSPVAIGAAIRVQDSLVDGRSHFLAEMQRLRRMINVAAEKPLLYLADEIMSGTNSQDRRIATEWVVRALVLRDAIGVITTHDLALTEIATNGLPGQNVHFEDTGESGNLNFDYKVRPGLLTHSNALNIAHMLGIDAAAIAPATSTGNKPD